MVVHGIPILESPRISPTYRTTLLNLDEKAKNVFTERVQAALSNGSKSIRMYVSNQND